VPLFSSGLNLRMAASLACRWSKFNLQNKWHIICEAAYQTWRRRLSWWTCDCLFCLLVQKINRETKAEPACRALVEFGQVSGSSIWPPEASFAPIKNACCCSPKQYVGLMRGFFIFESRGSNFGYLYRKHNYTLTFNAVFHSRMCKAQFYIFILSFLLVL
jgi:hypothetical protein